MKAILKIKLLFIFFTVLFLFTLNYSSFTNPIEIKPNKDLMFNKSEMKLSAVQAPLFEYIEIVNSCDPYFKEICVNIRSGPSIESDVVGRLRNNIVLKVDKKIEANGEIWYKISFDEWLRYPERVSGDMYVFGGFARFFLDEGNKELKQNTIASSSKTIIVDRGEQILYAYNNDKLFMKEKISTGIELTPTPRGIFTIYKKTPTRYMQGPIPEISEKEYDLPGVPWNLYFTKEGAVIHGAYWHDKFGQVWSNGCVNLPPEKAHELYDWAELGTKVIVRD